MDKDRVAETLVKIRGDRSQEEMARLLGVVASAVGNYERGIRMPRDEVKLKYSRISGMSVDDIFFAKDDTKRV